MEDLARIGENEGSQFRRDPDWYVSGRCFSFVNLGVFGGRWICLLKVSWQAAVDDLPNFRHQAVAAAEVLGLDRLVKDYGHNARLDPESSLRHDVVCSYDGYRHDWHAAFLS
jgi:hypothetical protein